jgi:MarR family transcriptional regulator, organic hydroperoxide resistance regulator
MDSHEYDSLKIENQLCFPLYACAKEIVRRYHPFLKDIDLTYTQYIAMMVLWEKESINVKELGNILFLDSGTLTPLLKKLEQKGLITRSRSLEDERNVLISITKEGIYLKEKALEIPKNMVSCLNLDKEKAMVLASQLNSMLNDIALSYDK